jgi:hypothetical protein
VKALIQLKPGHRMLAGAVFIGKDRQYNRRFLRMSVAPPLQKPSHVPE